MHHLNFQLTSTLLLSIFAACQQNMVWFLQRGRYVSKPAMFLFRIWASLNWGHEGPTFLSLSMGTLYVDQGFDSEWHHKASAKKGVPWSALVWTRRPAAGLRIDEGGQGWTQGGQSGSCCRTPDRRWWGFTGVISGDGALALSGGINHRVPDRPRVRFMRKWEAPSRLPAPASEGCPKEQWRWSR